MNDTDFIYLTGINDGNIMFYALNLDSFTLIDKGPWVLTEILAIDKRSTVGLVSEG